jgi:hypothetical protein
MNSLPVPKQDQHKHKQLLKQRETGYVNQEIGRLDNT